MSDHRVITHDILIVGAGLWLLRDRPGVVIADGTAATVPTAHPSVTRGAGPSDTTRSTLIGRR